MALSRRYVAMAAAGCLALLVPPSRPATANNGYGETADALFDLYAQQSIRLSIANAARQRPPGTEELLTSHSAAMLRLLARHRSAFKEHMARALAAHVPDKDLSRLRESLQAVPAALDEPQRQMMFAVDAEFRREGQSVIGAMTTDIGLMIATTLAETAGKR